MAITLGDMSVKREKRKNKDGSETPYSHICITLRNSGDTAVDQQVTFHRVVIPKGGATPSTPARDWVLCTAGPKPVPPKRVVVKPTSTGEADGTEEFCCDFFGEEEDLSGFGEVVIWAEVGSPQPKDANGKHKPIELGHGDTDYKTLKVK